MTIPKKIVISPGQGLLILIDHYKHLGDTVKVGRLKKLYLCGAENAKEVKEIQNLLKDPCLSQYKISFNSQTINNDPTRRYFETHLAYESLKHGLAKIDKDKLHTHFERLKESIPIKKRKELEGVLNGTFNDKDKALNKEYADYIAKIKSGKMFAELSQDDRDKIELLAKCSFLGVLNAQLNRLPLNIYGTGIYSEKNKGKVLIGKEQSTTRSQNLGILKGHMPVALDDLARSSTEIPYLKPSDQSDYIEHAQWVKANFGQLVHPFSNSISGTMLCQLRSHADLRNQAVSEFIDSAENLEQYSRLMASAMLLHSGGHTIKEFTAPLSLPQVKKEFRGIPGFDQISLESMYLTNNEEGFDAALTDAIAYNKNILLRDNLHAQIKGNLVVEPKNDALTRLKYKQELNSLSELVTATKESYDIRIKSQIASTFREGAEKNIYIQEGLQEVIKHLDNGELEQARIRISKLEGDIVTHFGKTNFWGGESESYKIAHSLKAELDNAMNYKEQTFKDRLSDIKPKIPFIELDEEGNVVADEDNNTPTL